MVSPFQAEKRHFFSGATPQTILFYFKFYRLISVAIMNRYLQNFQK